MRQSRSSDQLKSQRRHIALVVLADWSPMDTGEKCKFLQETLGGAA